MSRFPSLPRALRAAVILLALTAHRAWCDDAAQIPSLPPLKSDLARELSEESKAALLRKIAALEAAEKAAEKAATGDAGIQAQLGAAYFQLGSGYLKTAKTSEAAEAFRTAVRFQPSNAEAWEALGMSLASLEKMDDALDALRRASDADPKSFDIAMLRGGLLMKSGRLPEAAEAFSKAATLDPNSNSGYAMLGFVHLEQHQPETALADFERALKIDPHDSETLTNRGCALLALNDLTGAIASTRSALAANPENLAARRNLAGYLAGAHLYEEAAVEAKALIARQPSDKDAWAVLGEANIKRERYPEGVEAMSKARSLGFDSLAASMELLTGLLSLGRLDEAEKILSALEASDPKNADVLASLGDLRSKQRRLEESVRYAEESLAIDPKNVVALMTLANISVNRNQPEEAVRYARRALDANPRYWRAWGVISLAEEQRSNPEAALAACKKITEIAPEHFAGWQGIARFSNDFAEACAAAEKSLERAPDDLTEQVLLPYTQERFGRYTEALASYESALAKYPRNAMLAETFDQLLSRQRGPERALKQFQSMVAGKPDWPLGWRMVGVDLVGLNRYSEAVDALKKALSLDEKNPAFWKDLGVIYLARFKAEDSFRFAREAESALRKSLELDPRFAPAAHQLSIVLSNEHRPAEAEEYCVQALRLNANSIEAWKTLSEIRIQRGQFPEAVQACEQALKLDPKNEGALTILAKAASKKGDMDLAKSACDRLAEINAPLAEKLRQELLR